MLSGLAFSVLELLYFRALLFSASKAVWAFPKSSLALSHCWVVRGCCGRGEGAAAGYVMMYPGALSALLLARQNHTQNDTWLPSIGSATSSVADIARKAVESIPQADSWSGTIGIGEKIEDWMRFTVADAGNGQVAFHNSVRNRYLKMNGENMQVSPPPRLPTLTPPDTLWSASRCCLLVTVSSCFTTQCSTV